MFGKKVQQPTEALMPITAAPLSVPLRRDLAFDIGLHRGEDTAYYLRKGYRVVAFEANPDLIAHNEDRFGEEIAAGRLTLVYGAISDTTDETIRFYRHATRSVWGTINADWAERNAGFGESVPIDVPVVQFADVIERHGMPWFMKVDIEGADRYCLETLCRFDVRPAYLSIESEKKDWNRLLAEFDVLQGLGYDRFAAVQEDGIDRRIRPFRTSTLTGEPFSYRFEPSASGPFGEDITRWREREEVVATYRRIFREYRLLGDGSPIQRSRTTARALNAFARLIHRPLPGWYDTHAARSEVVQTTGARTVAES